MICWPHPAVYGFIVTKGLIVNQLLLYCWIKKKEDPNRSSFNSLKYIINLLSSYFVRNRESFSSFCSSTGKNFSSVCSRHSFTEPVLISSFSYRWLKCPFHRSIFLILFFAVFLEVQRYLFFNMQQTYSKNILEKILVCCFLPL